MNHASRVSRVSRESILQLQGAMKIWISIIITRCKKRTMHGTAFISSLLLVFAAVSPSSGFVASGWKTERRSKLIQGESGDSYTEDSDEISKVLRQAACDRSLPTCCQSFRALKNKDSWVS